MQPISNVSRSVSCRLFQFLAIVLLAASSCRAAAVEPVAEIGVPVAYALPTDGPLPRTWRVTLAIVEAKNPDWIISQFACGVPRTVTAANNGKFTEIWNGLDDNFMPVPPGDYAVKGICMPAEKWPVDGAYHSIVPRYLTEASSFQPPTTPWNTPEPFGGDPVGSPLQDVAVGANGVAVMYYGYLENGSNNAMVDLKKPLNNAAFVCAYGSGGAAGGTSTATDGETVWSLCAEGGPRYVYRADGKSFGTGKGAYRNHVHSPDGTVMSLAVWCEPSGPARRLFIAQTDGSVAGAADHLTVLDGADGKSLADIPMPRPLGVVVRGDELFALHARDGGWAVSSISLASGIPKGAWKQRFALKAGLTPGGFAVDHGGRVYVSEPQANHVHQFDAKGTLLRTLGKESAQREGAYDRETFMSPGKLAAWTAADGSDRLLVIEQHGPNRLSEWSAEGKLVREILTLQTKANDGWAVDPDHPERVYINGHGGWLTRFIVDADQQKWTVDAVWRLAVPAGGGVKGLSIETQQDPAAFEATIDHPQFIRRNNIEYLASARGNLIYRHAGDRWLLSSGMLRKQVDNKTEYLTWHDANGDGAITADECAPMALPGRVLRYHGSQWLDDLSLVSLMQEGRSVQRLAPDSFDAHGNPVFSAFRLLLTDPVFEARAAGTADAVHGGNELAEIFTSDWAMADGSMEEGFYVHARGGPSFSANYGSQFKLSRYVPDGKGGFSLKWRTGRAGLGSIAEPGEVAGAIHLRRPLNGLVSVIDQSRCGVLLYTTEGLYVDTLFPDGRAFSNQVVGIYSLPGEFFGGAVYPDRATGRINFSFGKFSPQIFTADGWSLRDNPVRALPELQKTVQLDSKHTAPARDIAVSLRGGAGKALVADVSPALGGAVLDGSRAGWEACLPVRFQADKDHTVEARMLYDPQHVYVRWHVRLGQPFAARPLAPLERIFTHDRLADTVSLYLQGDPNAVAATARESGKDGDKKDGRPGDTRIVFGLFDDGGTLKPVALGMYPKWPGKGTPQRYATVAGGTAAFEHIAPVAGVRLGYRIDEDKAGFVIVAELPCTAFPGLAQLGSDVRTLIDFEATFAGHAKVWWANRDGSASRETYDEPTEARLYPGAWAPVRFIGLSDGVVLRDWQVCGPFGGAGAETFSYDPGGDEKERARHLFDEAVFPLDDRKVDLAAVFSGALVRGWWPDPGKVRWQPRTVADPDTRVVFGLGAQVWYGATWIQAPEATQVEFQIQSHNQTHLLVTLNDQELNRGEIRVAGEVPFPTRTVPVQLRAGWNQVWMRGFCVGYPPFRGGVVVKAEPSVLWKLRLSGNPPAAR